MRAVRRALLLGSMAAVALAVPALAVEPSARVQDVPTPSGPVRGLRLEGLPAGVGSVAICGNRARRWSEDCDTAGSRGLEITADGAAWVVLPLRPPIGCPCVARITYGASDRTFVLPIELPEVPTIPPGEEPVDPFDRVAAQQLEVRAEVVDGATSPIDAVVGGLAGPAPRQLQLDLRNTGDRALSGLRVAGAVGRSDRGGASLAPLELPTLDPGQQTTVALPFTVDLPSAGRWVVVGDVVGLGSPVRFRTETDVRPWGLFVVGGAALVGLVAVMVNRRRRRRARLAAT